VHVTRGGRYDLGVNSRILGVTGIFLQLWI
jgi:hypothetical protein